MDLEIRRVLRRRTMRLRLKVLLLAMVQGLLVQVTAVLEPYQVEESALIEDKPRMYPQF